MGRLAYVIVFTPQMEAMRAFYQNGSTWTDSTAQYQKDLRTQNVAFGSNEYYDLLKTHPESAQWLALGNAVDVVIGTTLYQIR